MRILSRAVACTITPGEREEMGVGLRSYSPAAVSPTNTLFPLKKSFFISGSWDVVLARYDFNTSEAERTVKGFCAV